MEHVIEIFHKGGPIMWPLLVCSLTALTVVFERLLFVAIDLFKRDPAALGNVLGLVERGDWAAAEIAAKASRDPVVRVLAAGRDAPATRLAEVMTPSPRTVGPEQSFGHALQLMHAHGFRHMPVVEGGRVVGIVTARDALDPDMEEFVCEVQRREGLR